MKTIIYSKKICSYCANAKALLENYNVDYEEIIIGEDITRENFINTFPNIKSVPFIIIDDVRIGGFSELKEWVFQNYNM